MPSRTTPFAIFDTPVSIEICRTGRFTFPLFTPIESHWIQAAEILSAVRKRQPYDANQLRASVFDVLIALSVCSIAAAVTICNESDFQAIRRHVSFHLV